MTLEELLMKQGSTGAANFFATGNDMARVQKEVQQQRELGQIKSGVAGSTGPDDAIKRLMAIGTPAAIEIASKLKGLREPAQAVAPGAALVQGGKEVYRNPAQPLTGMPEILKLQEALKNMSPDSPYRKPLEDRINRLNSSENSQTQEMMNYILDVKKRTESGVSVSPDELSKASLIYRYMTTPRMDASGAVIQPSLGPEFDPSQGFGKRPSPAPRAAVPGGPAPTVLPGGRGTVTPGAVKPSEGEMKVLSESDALKGHLQDLDKLYDKSYVGPLAGRYGSVRAATTGFPENKSRSEFIAQSALYKNRLIKFITGAQMGEAETSRLIKEIPDAIDPPTTFEAKRKISEKNIDYVTKAYQQNMRQAGVRNIGGNPVSPNAPRKTIFDEADAIINGGR